MARGRRTRHELRRGEGQLVARSAREDAQRIRQAWDEYVAKGAALAAITACTSSCPDFAEDVVPTVCQLLQGHPPGEEDGGHRHRVLGTQVVVRW